MQQNARTFFQSAMLSIKLEEDGYELIYVDEFSIEFTNEKLYG